MSKSSRVIDGLKTNTLYSFQVRAKNSVGVWSDLPTAVTLTTSRDTSPPPSLSSITLLLLNGFFQLKWAKPTTLDLRGGGYKVYVWTSNTPASALLIKEIGYTSNSTEIFIGDRTQDGSLTITAGTTYWWWVTTLDASNNESARVATTPASGSVSVTGTGLAHNVLSNLSYATAGHTGFEPTVTKGNLTAGSSKITIGGTGTGALIGAGASVDVVESNVIHNNLGGLTTGDPHSQYAFLTGRSGGQTIHGGTGSGNSLYLRATSHATKGNVILCDDGGNVGIATGSPSISDGFGLHLGGKIIRLDTSKTPASASATGNVGEICWDANYIYVCVGSNSWKRVGIVTW